MAGPAGPAIGTGLSNPIPIGGATKATADGAATARGCLQNFVGFRQGMSVQEPLPEDFNATDDNVTRGATGNVHYIPNYAAGTTPGHETLTWAVAP